MCPGWWEASVGGILDFNKCFQEAAQFLFSSPGVDMRVGQRLLSHVLGDAAGPPSLLGGPSSGGLGAPHSPPASPPATLPPGAAPSFQALVQQQMLTSLLSSSSSSSPSSPPPPFPAPPSPPPHRPLPLKPSAVRAQPPPSTEAVWKPYSP